MSSVSPRFRQLAPLVSIALLAVGLWVLRNELAAHHPRDIWRAVGALPLRSLLTALGLTVLSYLVLAGYDALGLRYIHHSLGFWRTLFVGSAAYAFSQSLGFPFLTGGSIRYRLYASWGLSGVEIGEVVGFGIVTFWAGSLALSGLSMAIGPSDALVVFPFPLTVARTVGVGLVAIPICYLVVTIAVQRSFDLGGWTLRLPRPTLAATQIGLGSIDWILAALVLWILLPPGIHLSFLIFAGVYVIAQVAGVLSHVPGGLGVFEGLLVLLLRGEAQAASLVGSLVIYRLVYYLIPLTIATVGLGAYEIRIRRETVARMTRTAVGWLPPLVPRLMAATTFAGGVILLISGVLPRDGSRLDWLSHLIPLSVIELSHFLGSLAGIGLLILARGLSHRLDGAFHATLALLAAGIAASLVKGADYEEAMILTVVLLSLWGAKAQFTRRASLWHVPFSPAWTVAVGTVVVASGWLGFFAYRHVPYRAELWWDFALRSDAPRFLRATVGVVAAVSAFALSRLFTTARVRPLRPDAGDLDQLQPIIDSSPRTYAHLALVGDKSVLVNRGRTAFVMYDVSGRSWISMGDPVGDPLAFPDLVWEFRRLVDRHNGRPVFYQAAPENLPLYLDLGLRPLKIGEEATVSLPTFTLEGGDRRRLRQAKRQAEKNGCEFCVLSPGQVTEVLAELRDVSDAWLTSRGTKEKRFSLGRFDATYVSRFPTAVIRYEGRIAAFATVWPAATRAELSIDLMRHTPTAPTGTMEFLFIELMLWGKHEGYEQFNLGMAPLSGIEGRALAPLWNRVNALVFRHGEHFYRFKGLRLFKDKFDPTWSPRYLVTSGGLSLPRCITDVAVLISG